jgi:single stranded DNA-binding protein
MAGLISVTILGNVGSEPELNNSGPSPRLSFRVAVNTWDKTKGESTTWFGVTVWGAYAESLSSQGRIRKGTTVAVSGQLSTREYTDKTGKNVTALDIRPDTVQAITPRPSSGSGGTDDPPF